MPENDSAVHRNFELNSINKFQDDLMESPIGEGYYLQLDEPRSREEATEKYTSACRFPMYAHVGYTKAAKSRTI